MGIISTLQETKEPLYALFVFIIAICVVMFIVNYMSVINGEERENSKRENFYGGDIQFSRY